MVTNQIFNVVFISEALLKLVAFGTSYFENSWNKFDFFVVSCSIFEILIGFLDKDILQRIEWGPAVIRLLRVLRVTRIVRLVGKAEGLQAILQTIMFSIPSLMNVLILLLLIFFIFSIMGYFLFNQVQDGEVIDDFKNFRNFK